MDKLKTHIGKIIIGLFVAIFIIGLIVSVLSHQNSPSFESSEKSGFVRINNLVDSQNETSVDNDSITNLIKVDITGEVNNPGVYELQSKARLQDLVKLAGGLTAKADSNQINQSVIIKDQDKIIIPSVGESDVSSTVGTTSQTSANDQKVNINTASEAQLQTLKGIGQKKAQAIIDYRQKNGKFKTIEDLKEISGIGDKFIESIKNEVKV